MKLDFRLRRGAALLALVGALTGLTQYASAQLSNPIPTPITKQGLRVQIEDFVQMPDTRGTLGNKPDQNNSRARINFLREAPDGRLFVNDLRGQIYSVDKQTGQSQVFVDIDAANGGASSIFRDARFQGGLAAGLISFNFHPEFETNGLFYTIHLERAQDVTAVPGFATVDFRPGVQTKWHTIVTEWDAANPEAATWNEATGSRRELLRVGTSADAYFHPFGDLEFNPSSQPGDDDYGLLYISGGDWGYINGAGAPQGSGTDGQPGQLQRLDTMAGTMIRIDPRSPSVSGGIAATRGDYTIPAINPFVDGDPNTFDEVYALGFRNAHRMAWDDDGTLFVTNIGHTAIEEIERVIPGGNYGWTEREGTFINTASSGGSNGADQVFPMNLTPEQDVDFRGEPFLYPTAQFDHGEGSAIAGGFIYKGSMIPELQGKFVFGDIVNGRLFATDVETMKNIDLTDHTTTAAVEEIQLFTKNAQGVETNIDLRSAYFGGGRVDLRFGQTSDGEIWLLTKTDGFVRRLVGEGPGPLELLVNRETGLVTLINNNGDDVAIDGYSILSASGGLDPTGWQSLASRQYEGWEEASPTANALSELNADGTLDIAGSGSIAFGNPFVGTQVAFGMNLEDIAFEYRTAGGLVVQGNVTYEGVGKSNNLSLLVDPVTGEASLVNDSEFSVTLGGYSILSASGALDPGDAAWESLADQGRVGWDEGSPTQFALSELSPGGVLLAPGEAFDLGEILAASADDLVLEFLVDGEGAPRLGSVSYMLRGDFNSDGVVDAADYTLWRDNLGGAGGAADGTGAVAGVADGVVDIADYQLWREHFGNQAPGAGAAGGVPTPEPGCLTLFGLVATMLSFRQPNRARG
ncbi:PQQ-dependent sugar dehydrogenase [Pirellulimonas nuda]|uniref:PQQ-dependent sugar dehydrogenase n=1 Tax=Pirellulimonas nuda TaxID=2528009 RepID=UPI0018D4642B|nr:PQQ-dependent sugar dehydrogenase [Pirellulimonas nuda]